MKKYIWAKTLLTIYRYLERIAQGIDNQIDKIAENSFYVTGRNFLSNSTSVVANNIIDLSERKVLLINTKVLIEDTLEMCGQDLAQILIQKYIDGDKAREISERYQMSNRTYFRKLDEGLRQFSIMLTRKGYTDTKLLSLLKTEDWIMIFYEQINEGGEQVTIEEKLLKKLASC